MKIYTKTGDQGQTSLANGQRVAKSDERLDAYGTVDELNAFVGLLRSYLIPSHPQQVFLEWVQNKLFNLGAALAQASGEWITTEDVQLLERHIDALQADLPAFQGFVLPAGSKTVCMSHVCRTITRRLEREMVRLGDENFGCEKYGNFLKFVNRLGDFWFVFAQNCGKNEGVSSILWKK